MAATAYRRAQKLVRNAVNRKPGITTLDLENGATFHVLTGTGLIWVHGLTPTGRRTIDVAFLAPEDAVSFIAAHLPAHEGRA